MMKIKGMNLLTLRGYFNHVSLQSVINVKMEIVVTMSTGQHQLNHLGSLSEKNTGIFWEFFPNGGPPRPPIWEASVLGPKEHFWFLRIFFLSRFNRLRPEIPFLESDQIDQMSPPPYCITCFSTSE